jgi:CDP-paratose 2-epimerase
VFASTNKVYGALGNLEMEEQADRYTPASRWVKSRGIDSSRPLAFCTPYGCSKGTADQYVLDYAHSFGLRTDVLRKSCIYGPRQFGTEDQGWAAQFLIRALRGEPVVIYGDGKQVRDVLHVTDAVSSYRSVLREIGNLSGQAFNLGGGIENAVSLLVVLEEIAAINGREVAVTDAERRTGDQAYFVADTSALADRVGWRPAIGWRAGLRDLADWLAADLGLAAPRPRRSKRSARA